VIDPKSTSSPSPVHIESHGVHMESTPHGQVHMEFSGRIGIPHGWSPGGVSVESERNLCYYK